MSQRKLGRNKKSCDQYKSEHRREKNKERKAKRYAKQLSGTTRAQRRETLQVKNEEVETVEDE